MPTYKEPDLEDVLVGLVEMQKTFIYVGRWELLARIEQVVRTQLSELDAATKENEQLKKQLTDALNDKFGPNNLNLKGITRQPTPPEPNHCTFSMKTQPDQRAEPIHVLKYHCTIGSNDNSIGSKPHHG